MLESVIIHFSKGRQNVFMVFMLTGFESHGRYLFPRAKFIETVPQEKKKENKFRPFFGVQPP